MSRKKREDALLPWPSRPLCPPAVPLLGKGNRFSSQETKGGGLSILEQGAESPFGLSLLRDSNSHTAVVGVKYSAIHMPG